MISSLSARSGFGSLSSSERRAAECAARRRHEEVVVLRDVEDGFAGIGIRLFRGREFDVETCALDELPLRECLFAESVVGGNDSRILGLVLSLVVELSYLLCAGGV